MVAMAQETPNATASVNEDPADAAETGTAATATASRKPTLWSSTGGGWCAMFADVGHANVLQVNKTDIVFEATSLPGGGVQCHCRIAGRCPGIINC